MITKTQLYQFNKLPDRLKSKIEINDKGCWLYKGEINRNGYGRINIYNTRFMVHRFTYKILKDDIGSELYLDHLCKCRNCCNPAHLSPVTTRQNVYRGKAKLFSPRRGC